MPVRVSGDVLLEFMNRMGKAFRPNALSKFFQVRAASIVRFLYRRDVMPAFLEMIRTTQSFAANLRQA